MYLLWNMGTFNCHVSSPEGTSLGAFCGFNDQLHLPGFSRLPDPQVRLDWWMVDHERPCQWKGLNKAVFFAVGSGILKNSYIIVFEGLRDTEYLGVLVYFFFSGSFFQFGVVLFFVTAGRWHSLQLEAGLLVFGTTGLGEDWTPTIKQPGKKSREERKKETTRKNRKNL